jgi:ubiquinone/menaquinone biosynthesis C-methylase UbiE
MLHHLEQSTEFTEVESKAIDEIRRVLKRGGLLIYGEILHKHTVRDLLLKAGFLQVFAKRSLFFRDLDNLSKGWMNQGLGILFTILIAQ